jgi:hypothetical protein
MEGRGTRFSLARCAFRIDHPRFFRALREPRLPSTPVKFTGCRNSTGLSIRRGRVPMHQPNEHMSLRLLNLRGSNRILGSVAGGDDASQRLAPWVRAQATARERGVVEARPCGIGRRQW